METDNTEEILQPLSLWDEFTNNEVECLRKQWKDLDVNVFKTWWEMKNGEPFAYLNLSDNQKIWAVTMAGYGGNDKALTETFDDVYRDVALGQFDFETSGIAEGELLLGYAFAECLTQPPSKQILTLFEIAHRLIQTMLCFPKEEIERAILSCSNEATPGSLDDIFEVIPGSLGAILFDILPEINFTIKYGCDNDDLFDIPSLVFLTFMIMDASKDRDMKTAEGKHTNQKRHAAYARHKPSRKTKEYAIKLFNKKEWHSTRAASRAISDDVVEYGKVVGFIFADNHCDRIYDWLLQWNKK